MSGQDRMALGILAQKEPSHIAGAQTAWPRPETLVLGTGGTSAPLSFLFHRDVCKEET